MLNHVQYKILILFFFLNISIGQEKEISVHFGKNPTNLNYWWLEKNNFGIKPEKFYLNNKLKIQKSKFNFQIDFLLQEEESYFKETFLKYNFSDNTFLRLGKYYRDFSTYLNDSLSSGHMLISHNAEPMPKIGLVSSKKIKKNKNISFDFGISHGVFNYKETIQYINDRGEETYDFYTKSPFLHEKFLYININKKNYKVGIGLVHEAMWAGSTLGNGQQPNKLKDFFKILTAEDGPYEGGPHANALGNHLGIWDFYYEKNNNDKIIKIYYQHFFEDTSSLRFRNEIDGLWGIELKNYISNTNILLEYLDTSHAKMDPPYQLDYYYSNYQYTPGWTYGNNIIGNPFVNSDGSEAGFEELKLLHLGIDGEMPSNHYYKIKISKRISKNDNILYKALIGKNLKNNIDFNAFVVNNGINNGLGMNLNYFFDN